MNYPTIENKIINDKQVSEWLKAQMLETRDLDSKKALNDLQMLKVIIEMRIDRQIRERKTFQTQVNLKAIDLEL